jgi:hypothetical protein
MEGAPSASHQLEVLISLLRRLETKMVGMDRDVLVLCRDYIDTVCRSIGRMEGWLDPVTLEEFDRRSLNRKDRSLFTAADLKPRLIWLKKIIAKCFDKHRDSTLLARVVQRSYSGSPSRLSLEHGGPDDTSSCHPL